jgi:hypothetical protein
MITTYERGKIAGQLELAVKLLEAKFGTLSDEGKRRLEALSSEELGTIMLEYYKALSLKDLGLED